MIVCILIMLLAIMFAFLSQKRILVVAGASNDVKNDEFNLSFFVISFLLLFILSALSKNGPDIPVYVANYSNWDFSDLLDLQYEAGYKLLCILLRTIIKNPYIGIAVIKLITLYMVYKAMYLLKDRISIGLAVIGYVILLYLLSFFLLRMMLAVGLVYLAFAYEITGRRKLCIFLLILAFFFHYTSCVVWLAYVVYIFLGSKLTYKKVVLLVLGVSFFTVFADKILSRLISLLSFMNKYETYSLAEDNSGIAQLILFLPILYLIIQFNQEENCDRFYSLSTIAAILAFGIGSLGYIYEVIARMVYYFYFFAIMYGASVVNKRDKVCLLFKSAKMDLSILMIVIYFLMQLMISILANSIGFLENYAFIWS